jgi:hypothetical protein
MYENWVPRLRLQLWGNNRNYNLFYTLLDILPSINVYRYMKFFSWNKSILCWILKKSLN